MEETADTPARKPRDSLWALFWGTTMSANRLRAKLFHAFRRPNDFPSGVLPAEITGEQKTRRTEAVGGQRGRTRKRNTAGNRRAETRLKPRAALAFAGKRSAQPVRGFRVPKRSNRLIRYKMPDQKLRNLNARKKDRNATPDCWALRRRNRIVWNAEARCAGPANLVHRIQYHQTRKDPNP